MGPRADIPVRDIRLRDPAGQEHLVRIKGDLLSGSVAVGDDIDAGGYDRHGTLMFRRGMNKRIGTAIRVRQG